MKMGENDSGRAGREAQEGENRHNVMAGDEGMNCTRAEVAVRWRFQSSFSSCPGRGGEAVHEGVLFKGTSSLPSYYQDA